MALRTFYFIRTLTKAPTYYYMNRSQRHLLDAIENNRFGVPIHSLFSWAPICQNFRKIVAFGGKPRKIKSFNIILTSNYFTAIWNYFASCCHSYYSRARTVSNKKHTSSWFWNLCFSCISSEPIELQKSYFHLFASLSKELSDEKIIFQIR